MKLFGQRAIKYRDAVGGEGIIHIDAYADQPVDVEVGGGEIARDYAGKITIHCDLFTRTIRANGDDHLHLSMLLMWLSDSWLRKVCLENRIRIYKYIEGDIEGDLSVYKP